ncbi:MAG: hypothetical protein NZ908_02905 [Candidatus Micrarchaeota archaeon]|nr:hypothetical protein [Candidatus Micrarchaeota archaeon]
MIITVFLILALYGWAGTEEEVYRRYYNDSSDLFHPELMYRSTIVLENIHRGQYLSLDRVNRYVDSMFEEFRRGRDYFRSCYLFYNMSLNFCSNPVLVRSYFQGKSEQELRDEMQYNSLYSLIFGVRIVEISREVYDSENNRTYTEYDYRLESSGYSNCLLLAFSLLYLPAKLVIFIMATNYISGMISGDECRVATVYYRSYLENLGAVMNIQREELSRSLEELNAIYTIFRDNGGCSFYPEICRRSENLIHNITNTLRRYNTTVDRMLEDHHELSILSTSQYNQSLLMKTTLTNITDTTSRENQMLLENLAERTILRYCADEMLIYVDYQFRDGSPRDHCLEAYSLISMYRDTDSVPRELFFLNSYLKTLDSKINKYNSLNDKAYDKARVAIDALRKRLHQQISKAKLSDEVKRRILSEIDRDRATLGETYLFLKNFRIQDYSDSLQLITRIEDLIQRAKRDEIDVSIEEMLLASADQEDLYRIEQSIYMKARTKYNYLLDMRSQIEHLISKLPPGTSRSYITELRRIDGGNLSIENNIGNLKSIDRQYSELLIRLRAEVVEYLKNSLNIDYRVIYPERFYTDTETRVYLIVNVCNPYDIDLSNIRIPTNPILNEFKLNIQIPHLEAGGCRTFEAYREEVFAESSIIRKSATLIDAVLKTNHILVIKSRLNGIAVYQGNEYRVNIGENRFQITEERVVPLYFREIRENNTVIVEIEWRYGNYESINVSYRGMRPCGVRGNVFRFCNTTSEVAPIYQNLLNVTLNNTSHIPEQIETILNNTNRNRTISYINSTLSNLTNRTNISLNISNISREVDLNNHTEVSKYIDRKTEQYIKELFNILKNAMKSNEAYGYLTLLYSKALAGNRSALQEMERMYDKMMNRSSMNFSFLDRYEIEYVPEYFDLNPKSLRERANRISELYLYDESKALQELDTLKSTLDGQYETAKDRIRLLLSKYSEEDRNRVERMLQQNRIKDALAYMKSTKPISAASRETKQETGHDLRIYALGVVLLMIGIVVYYILTKRKREPEFRTLEEDNK